MVRESVVAQLWKHQLIRSDDLMTVGGQKVRVLYPGRQSSDSGPDFCDAAIIVEGEGVVRGDIELHVRSQEWQAHGHHRDPNYNSVILHVVLWGGGREASLLNNGGEVPVLALSPYLTRRLEDLHQVSPAEPCCGDLRRWDETSVHEVLKEAGRARFELKVRRFKEKLADGKADQVLYEGWMRALGYAKNKKPFEKLARMLPLNTLEEVRTRRGVVGMQALMLGTAGLLPSQRNGGSKDTGFSDSDRTEMERLEHAWYSFGVCRSMSVSEWRFFRVRPENCPPRRVAAASCLVCRHGAALLEHVLNLAEQAAGDHLQKELEGSMTVRCEGYWASHFDFGVEAGWRPSLIGRGRAREITVNVLLPFISCWARQVSLPWLERRAVQLYLDHSRVGENWVTRYMEGQIFGERRAKLNRACQQQGLIHLYKTHCAEKRCCDCPLSRRTTSSHRQPPGAGYLLDAEVLKEVE